MTRLDILHTILAVEEGEQHTYTTLRIHDLYALQAAEVAVEG